MAESIRPSTQAAPVATEAGSAESGGDKKEEGGWMDWLSEGVESVENFTKPVDLGETVHEGGELPEKLDTLTEKLQDADLLPKDPAPAATPASAAPGPATPGPATTPATTAAAPTAAPASSTPAAAGPTEMPSVSGDPSVPHASGPPVSLNVSDPGPMPTVYDMPTLAADGPAVKPPAGLPGPTAMPSVAVNQGVPMLDPPVNLNVSAPATAPTPVADLAPVDAVGLASAAPVAPDAATAADALANAATTAPAVPAGPAVAAAPAVAVAPAVAAAPAVGAPTAAASGAPGAATSTAANAAEDAGVMGYVSPLLSAFGIAGGAASLRTAYEEHEKGENELALGDGAAGIAGIAAGTLGLAGTGVAGTVIGGGLAAAGVAGAAEIGAAVAAGAAAAAVPVGIAATAIGLEAAGNKEGAALGLFGQDADGKNMTAFDVAAQNTENAAQGGENMGHYYGGDGLGGDILGGAAAGVFGGATAAWDGIGALGANLGLGLLAAGSGLASGVESVAGWVDGRSAGTATLDNGQACTSGDRVINDMIDVDHSASAAVGRSVVGSVPGLSSLAGGAAALGVGAVDTGAAMGQDFVDGAASLFGVEAPKQLSPAQQLGLTPTVASAAMAPVS